MNQTIFIEGKERAFRVLETHVEIDTALGTAPYTFSHAWMRADEGVGPWITIWAACLAKHAWLNGAPALNHKIADRARVYARHGYLCDEKLTAESRAEVCYEELLKLQEEVKALRKKVSQ